jgi:hypothetical protein
MTIDRIGLNWPVGSPERAVVDAFAAFQHRDGLGLARIATADSLLAFAVCARHAARRASARRAEDGSTGEPGSDSAETLIQRAAMSIPRSFLDSVRCAVLGHVSEDATVAHVLFRLLYRRDENTLTSFPPEPQVATMSLENGEWRLVLDEWSLAGFPGFRCDVWENDPVQTTAS